MLRFSLRSFAASLPRRRRYRIRRQRRSRIKVAVVQALEDRTLLSGMPPMTSPETYAVPYDSFDTAALSQQSVLSNDYDWESDPLTAVLDTDVTNGTLTLNSNGHFVYTPDAGFEGTDTFKYKAFDGTGYSSATTVTLNVSIAFGDRLNLEDRPAASAGSGSAFGASNFTGGFGATTPVAPGINLVYQSETEPNPVIAVESKWQGLSWADDVEVDLLLDTIQGDTIYYGGAYYSGLAYRFAHQVDASSLSTGRYDYEMSIVANFGSATSTRVISGTTHIVNRNDSEFGAGWWLQELDQLVIDTNGVLHVTGDGIASWFEDDSGTFLSPAGPFAHSTLVENQNGMYTLTDKYGNEAHFDPDGLLTQRVDRNGNTRTYTYTDADGDSVVDELWKITDAFSRVTTFAYTNGLLSSVTDIDGRVTTIAHDGSDRLTSVTRPDPDGAGAQSAPVTTYAYDGTTNRLSSITDALSRQTQVAYDFAGLVDEITYADSTTSSLDAWQPRGLVDTSVSGSQGSPAGFFLPDDPLVMTGGMFLDPLANPTEFELDRFGLLTSYTNALDELTRYERDANGQVTKRTDPDGTTVTQFEYDSSGNLTKIIHPDATTLVMVYSASNFLTSRKDELNRETTYTYDSYGNVLTMTDPLGNVASYDYDTAGRVIEVTLPDPDGGGALAAPVIGYAYDAYGRLTTITNPDATTIAYAYDTADRVTSVTDELSRVTSMTYDALDRLLTLTLPDPDGGGSQSAPVTTYAYDAVGNRLTTVDAAGHTTSYQYDNRNRLTKVTLPDPDGAGAQTSPILQRAYNAAGWLTSTTDALGNVTTYGYDNVGRLTSVTQPDPDGGGPLTAPVTSYLLDKLGRVTRITDPLWKHTYFEYDSRGRLTKRTDPDPDGAGALTSPVTQWAYDDAGQLTSVTDPLNRVTSFEYDDNGRLTKTTLPDPDGGGPQSAPEITRAYDNLGRLTTLTDPLGNVTTYAYDVTSRLIQRTDPDPDGGGALTSPVTQWAYDDAGQLTSLTDPLGQVTTYAYDNLGRQTSVTLPDPDGAGAQTAAVFTTTYDALGNVLTRTDPLSNTTENEYDNLSRLISSTDPELGETTFAYDANGNMTSLTDPVGNVTSWVFDNLGRVTSETNELSDTRSWTYDAAGNVLTATDRNGRVIEYDYDNLQRLVQELWKQSSTTVNTIDYTYDAASQLTAIADDVSAYAYTYDDLGRVTQVDNAGTSVGPNVVLISTYNAAGLRTSVRAEVDSTNDFINTYGYDNLGRMIYVQQVEPASGNSVAEKRVDFEYNAGGQYASITRWADITQTELVAATTFTYDEAHRLTGLSHDQGLTNLAHYAWTYDTSGRITSVTTVDGTDDYTYDDKGQLTGVDSDYQTNETYTYDANGNRTNTGYVTGDNNRLTSDGTYNYTYDDEGNRTKKTHISSGDYVEYTWDHRNRLTSVTFRDSLDVKTKEVTYVYDVFDRRIAKDVDDDGNGSIDRGERYVYDGSDIALVYDRSDTLVERLLYGPGVDQPLASENASGSVLWLLADNQGSIRDVAEYDAVSGDTTVVNHIQYGGFGNITAQSNASLEPRHTYTGREWDADAELFYYRARWFDPVVGRFISEDPIGFAAGDVNLARYVGNNSPNLVDPNGRTAVPNQALLMATQRQNMFDAWESVFEPGMNPFAPQMSFLESSGLNVYLAAAEGFMDGLADGIASVWHFPNNVIGDLAVGVNLGASALLQIPDAFMAGDVFPMPRFDEYEGMVLMEGGAYDLFAPRRMAFTIGDTVIGPEGMLSDQNWVHHEALGHGNQQYYGFPGYAATWLISVAEAYIEDVLNTGELAASVWTALEDNYFERQANAYVQMEIASGTLLYDTLPPR